MALYQIAQCLIEQGDSIVVENPSHYFFYKSLQVTGANIYTVPVNEAGIDVDALKILCEQHKVKMVVTYPVQCPTTIVTSPERRKHLLELAKQYRFAIVELDMDFEYWYEDQPLSRMSTNNLESNVIYLSCVSSLLPPFSFVNYVAGPSAFISSLKSRWNNLDNHEDAIMEKVMIQLLQNGTLSRYARRSSNIYKGKRDEMAKLLDTYLGDHILYDLPHGGMAFWIRFKREINVDRILGRLIEQDIKISNSKNFYFDNSPASALRLGFASTDISKLETGIKALAHICKSNRLDFQI